MFFTGYSRSAATSFDQSKSESDDRAMLDNLISKELGYSIKAALETGDVYVLLPDAPTLVA